MLRFFVIYATSQLSVTIYTTGECAYKFSLKYVSTTLSSSLILHLKLVLFLHKRKLNTYYNDNGLGVGCLCENEGGFATFTKIDQNVLLFGLIFLKGSGQTTQ